jgi:3-hydroxyacyl-CoA dehydrogenase
MKHADFIVEAVVEDEGVKKSIFQQLDKVSTDLGWWLRLCECG